MIQYLQLIQKRSCRHYKIRLIVESEKIGITLNQKKTEYVVIGKNEFKGSKLRTGSIVLKKVQKSNFLGRLISL